MRIIFLVTILVLSSSAFVINRTAHSAVSTARSASELYGKHCASCHGKDGRSKTLKAKFNHARNLTDASWQSDVSDERIFNSINNGRGKHMPAYKKKLSEPEIESLVAYVRALRR